jgi:hypothetical protein
MKPQVFFPFLFAAVGLTALMLLIMSSAGLVAGQPMSAEIPAEVETAAPEAAQDAAQLAITVPITLPWQAVAAGIDYVELGLTNPVNNVYIARMHRDALSVTLDTAIASGFLSSGKESVSQMAARYNQAINYWGQAPLTPTWGSRNDVIVAINGSYYDVPTGSPQSGMVQSGWYAKRFDDLGGSSGFAWKLDRSAFIGECVDHIEEKQLITYADAFSQTFQGINITRTNRSLVVYTPQYDVNTGTDDTGAEVLVTLSRPLLLIAAPRAVTGTITAIYTGTGSTPIPFDSVVLSVGKYAPVYDPVIAHAHVGEVISISQEIKSYRFNCSDPLSLDWGKTYSSLSGAFYFLRKGIIRPYNDDSGAIIRAPRTAIVYDNDYVYFVVVDGRSWLSRGMTIKELATFISTTLATPETITYTYGIAQDGGGSSTMVVNGEVKNYTLCNNAFCDHFNFLPLVGRPTGAVTLSESDGPLTQTQMIQPDQVDAVTAERYVANGIMMVVVEPMTATATFTPTQVVKTAVVADLRLGPGTNYAVLVGNIPKNTSLVIVPHELNGVLAKGSYWWKVDFNGTEGWVKESDLTPAVEGWR